MGPPTMHPIIHSFAPVHPTLRSVAPQSSHSPPIPAADHNYLSLPVTANSLSRAETNECHIRVVRFARLGWGARHPVLSGLPSCAAAGCLGHHAAAAQPRSSAAKRLSCAVGTLHSCASARGACAGMLHGSCLLPYCGKHYCGCTTVTCAPGRLYSCASCAAPPAGGCPRRRGWPAPAGQRCTHKQMKASGL